MQHTLYVDPSGQFNIQVNVNPDHVTVAMVKPGVPGNIRLMVLAVPRRPDDPSADDLRRELDRTTRVLRDVAESVRDWVEHFD